ncbi:hypothetical protein JN01_0602 [Entomoplasma freundtii]|uniref:Uncharacterized protein n=1 Tax=Entomoplasma freundtii TaxID=74700 RepID=A0A2K8NRE0_9MOLU|nr:hypothetical protein [Entomoplasma freundtii]ATZ16357.1 hypothetical protein EFREU_v1c03310 [Entomoplasma freundtii]TDY56604.1 hypothetical protein JN01_0602 [Entomoplasma freundtii]
MEKKTIDECLTSKLRYEIDKLIDLNLDLDSIWDLLQEDLEPYETYMRLEVQRFIKYLLWLRDNHKSREDAFLKYKRYTLTMNPHFRKEAPLSDLEQKWKDQRRIDELSTLMNYRAPKNQKIEASQSAEKLKTETMMTNLEETKLQDTLDATNNVLYNFTSQPIKSEKDFSDNVNLNRSPLESLEDEKWVRKPKKPNLEIDDEDVPLGEETDQDIEQSEDDSELETEVEDMSSNNQFKIFEDSEVHVTSASYSAEETQKDLDLNAQLEAIIATLSDDEIEKTASELVQTESTLSASLTEQIKEIHNIADQEPSLMLVDIEPDFNTQERQNFNQSDDRVFETIIENPFDITASTNSASLFDYSVEDNGTQTFNESFLESLEATEDLVTIMDTNINEPTPETTADALDFLQKMEDKYESDSKGTLVNKEDLTKRTFTKQEFQNNIGKEVMYEGSKYVIKDMEEILDFFQHPQKLVILENVETHKEIRINVRKLDTSI